MPPLRGWVTVGLKSSENFAQKNKNLEACFTEVTEAAQRRPLKLGDHTHDISLRIRWKVTKDIAAIKAAPGIVRTQAQTMRRATPHLTAESLRVEPTPTIAPVIVCVVDTGIPASVAPNRAIAPAVSAQNPPTGLSFVIFEPIVCTIRQPPERVPSAIAA